MISKHFKVQELVPPVIFHQYEDRSWQFIDPRLVELLDFIRDFYNRPVKINNWHLNGNRFESGFRLPDTKTGGQLSQHKFGRAADIHVEGMAPQQLHADILKNQNIFLNQGLTTVEDIAITTSWVHIDIRYTGFDHIYIVKPST
jgi:uncharacterized protein YcbK (DUF882 family)